MGGRLKFKSKRYIMESIYNILYQLKFILNSSKFFLIINNIKYKRFLFNSTSQINSMLFNSLIVYFYQYHLTR